VRVEVSKSKYSPPTSKRQAVIYRLLGSDVIPENDKKFTTKFRGILGISRNEDI
jgi:hypothetical protein